MTLNEIAEAVAALGVPWMYDHFDEVTQPPYVVYYYPGESDFMADGVNYANIRQLTIELFTSKKDFALESALETILRDRDLVWYKDTVFNNDEKLFQTTYETEVIINGGE